MIEVSNTKSRIAELDVLRAFAIIAVVGTHVASTVLQSYFEKQHVVDFGTQLSQILSQLFRFSVPLFLLLSGLTLTMSQLRHNASWLTFYEKRLTKIILPYVFWTVFFTYYLSSSFHWINLSAIWYNLHYGTADYHLYFMVIIIQAYILFPLFYYLLARCTTKVHFFVLVLAILGEGLLLWEYEFRKLHGLYVYDFYAFRFFSFWMAPFLCGIVVGFSYEKVVEMIGRFRWYLASAVFLAALAYIVWEANVYRIHYYEILTYFRPSVLVYSLVSFVVLYQLAAYIVRNGILTRVKDLLTAIGGASFGIYFIHTIILREEMSFGTIANLPSVLMVPVLLIMTVGISYFLVWLYHFVLQVVIEMVHRHVLSPGTPGES